MRKIVIDLSLYIDTLQLIVAQKSKLGVQMETILEDRLKGTIKRIKHHVNEIIRSSIIEESNSINMISIEEVE